MLCFWLKSRLCWRIEKQNASKALICFQNGWLICLYSLKSEIEVNVECTPNHTILSMGRGAYGFIKYEHTDDFFPKISLYRNIFSKIPIPNSFTASQVFSCISRQPDLNSFKIQWSIKYIYPHPFVCF